MQTHAVVDERSLAFGRAVASRLKDHPELIERARETLHRWMETASPRVIPVLQQWNELLDGPLERVMDVLTGSDELSTRLRQSTPFAGILTASERAEILRHYVPHDASTA